MEQTANSRGCAVIGSCPGVRPLSEKANIQMMPTHSCNLSEQPAHSGNKGPGCCEPIMKCTPEQQRGGGCNRVSMGHTCQTMSVKKKTVM